MNDWALLVGALFGYAVGWASARWPLDASPPLPRLSVVPTGRHLR